MGIGDKGILAVGSGKENVAVATVNAMMTDDAEVISIYYGCDASEEKAEELLIVELYTGIHLENGVPCGHFTLYLCGEPDGWKLSETRMMEYLQNL